MRLKKYSISVLTVLFSGLAWYFFSVIFNGPNILRGNGLNWLGFVLFEAISFAFLFIVSLAKDRYDFWLTTLLSSIWILVFMGVSVKTLLCAAVLFLFSQVLIEFPLSLERTLNLRYFSTSYAKLALVTLALIGISSAYLQNGITTSIQQQTFTENTTNYAWPYLSKYLSQFNSNETVDAYLREQFKSQGVANPPQSLINQERQSLSDQVGFEVSGNQKMSDLGKKFVSYKLGDLLKEFNLSRAGLYVIFFSLLVLWPIGRFIFAGLATIVYWIMKKSGGLKVKESQIITQTIEL